MYRILYYIHYLCDGISRKGCKWWGNVVSKGCLLVNKVELPTSIQFDGIPILRIAKGTKVSIGERCIIRSGRQSDSIGNRSHTLISVQRGGYFQ